MGTEYRHGIPSVAHIEAATRLGLLWRAERNHEDYWRFGIVGDDVQSIYDNRVSVTQRSRLTPCTDEERTASYCPIRADGTSVDWDVLDAEVARVQGPIVGTVLGVNANDTVSPATQAQTGPQCEECEGSGRIYGATHDGSRTCGECNGRGYMLPPRVPAAQLRRHGGIEPRRFADVRPDRHGWRWWRCDGARLEFSENAVFREFNPLENRWGGWNEWPVNYWRETKFFIPTDEQGNPVSWESIAPSVPTTAPTQPQGFRADLWQRMCPNASQSLDQQFCLSNITRYDGRVFHFRDDRTSLILPHDTRTGYTDANILARWAVYQELKPLYDIVDGAQGEAPMPEDVEVAWTVAANQSHQRMSLGYCRLGRNAETLYLISSSGLRWLPHESVYGAPLRNFATVLDAVAEQRVVNSAITRVVLSKVEASAKPEPLPRFTTDELDDVDHSQSTKLDSVPLKRGKLPTPEQIGKYREAMAKRNGTAAEALKASGIDCEVAQYVLERWASGLSDKEAQKLIADRYIENMNAYPRSYLDRVISEVSARPLDPAAEPTDDTAQRQREEREAQRLRMAALQAQLAAERAARTVEPQPEPTLFDLLECDPKADPAASIAAWEARQKRSTVRQMPKPQPPPAPHRLFEVVDAETEGLRPGAVFTALLGRALNPNC